MLRELGAKWIVEMAEYLSDNPQFITNGFEKAGILEALDGIQEEDVAELEIDFEGFSSADEDSEEELNEDSF